MNHDTVGKLVFEWHETGTAASQHGGRHQDLSTSTQPSTRRAHSGSPAPRTLCPPPDSTSMAEGVISGKGSSLAALPSHRSRRKSSQKKCSDGERQQNFEKQLEGLRWGLKMQKKARSKGGKMWAGRQIDKFKKKFAEEWLAKLEEKAKKSELKEEVSGWKSTQARNAFEKARRLLEEKTKIQKMIKRRFREEVKRIEKIDEELRELRGAVEGSNAGQAVQQVAAVGMRGELLEEKVGSSGGCEQGA